MIDEFNSVIAARVRFRLLCAVLFRSLHVLREVNESMVSRVRVERVDLIS